MHFAGLLSDADEAALGKWLRSAGDLFLHLEFPHSGGSGDSYLVRSLHELRGTLGAVSWPEVELWIFRQRQLPVRGVVSSRLIRAALRELPDDKWCTVCELVGSGPLYCLPLASAENHHELSEALTKLAGRQVAIGLDPLESGASDDAWTYAHPDEVFFLRHLRNRNFWPPYSKRRPSLYLAGTRPGT